jgi:hypothetical protein
MQFVSLHVGVRQKFHKQFEHRSTRSFERKSPRWPRFFSSCDAASKTIFDGRLCANFNHRLTKSESTAKWAEVLSGLVFDFGSPMLVK